MLITLFCVGRAEGEVRDAACFSCDICGSRAVIMHACPGAAVGPTCHQSSSAFVWDGGFLSSSWQFRIFASHQLMGLLLKVSPGRSGCGSAVLLLYPAVLLCSESDPEPEF